MANKDNDYKVNEIIIELDTDDKTDSDREYIEHIVSTIMTICNDFILRHPNINLCSSQGLTELLKDIRRKYKADINDIKELNILWDIYTVICCTCRIKPTLLRYCIMVNVDITTVSSWIKGEYSGRVTSGHSQTAQKWKNECESTLYDEVIQTGNIGCMFALKANYGYRDNIQIIQTDGRADLPVYSREEIAARAESAALLPGSVDDLPD